MWVVQFVWFGLVWFVLVDATFPSWPDLHQATRVEFFFWRLAQIVDSMAEYMEIALRALCGVVLDEVKGNPKYLELLEFFPPEACVPPGLLEALNKQATRAHRAQGPGDKKKTASHEEQ
jgi:hypothetical protein